MRSLYPRWPSWDPATSPERTSDQHETRVQELRPCRTGGPRPSGSTGTVGSAKFNSGTLVTLTAQPPAGKSFVGWGGACSGTDLTCTVPMDANKSVQANFSK